MSSLHPAAAQGFAARAMTYGAARPDYPPDVVGWLRAELGLGAGQRVLDLGAGTGKFLPTVLATGAAAIAVEPVAQMLDELRGRFAEVPALAAQAEALPLADGCVDAVLCATAFHWFAHGAALAEIHRVLKPGGRLGLIWNVRDESVPWVAALTAITDPYEGDAPRFRSLTWQKLFPGHGFGPLRELSCANPQRGDPETVIIGRTLSTSFIAAQPAREQALIIERVRDLIARTPELAERTEVTFPYCTRLFIAERLTA